MRTIVAVILALTLPVLPLNAQPASGSSPLLASMLLFERRLGLDVYTTHREGCPTAERPLVLWGHVADALRSDDVIRNVLRSYVQMAEVASGRHYCARPRSWVLHYVGWLGGDEVLRGSAEVRDGNWVNIGEVARSPRLAETLPIPPSSLETYFQYQVQRFLEVPGVAGRAHEMTDLLRQLASRAPTSDQQAFATWELARIERNAVEDRYRTATVVPPDLQAARDRFHARVRTIAPQGRPEPNWEAYLTGPLEPAVRRLMFERSQGRPGDMEAVRAAARTDGVFVQRAADAGYVRALALIEGLRRFGVELQGASVAAGAVPVPVEIERALNEGMRARMRLTDAAYTALMPLPPNAVVGCDEHWCTVYGFARMRFLEPSAAQCTEVARSVAQCRVTVRLHVMSSVHFARDRTPELENRIASLMSRAAPVTYNLRLERRSDTWTIVDAARLN